MTKYQRISYLTMLWMSLSLNWQKEQKDKILWNLHLNLLNKVLPENNRIAQLVYKMSQDRFVLNGVVWKCLGPPQQHRSVLLVPQHLIKEVLVEAHGHLLAGTFSE